AVTGAAARSASLSLAGYTVNRLLDLSSRGIIDAFEREHNQRHGRGEGERVAAASRRVERRHALLAPARRRTRAMRRLPPGLQAARGAARAVIWTRRRSRPHQAPQPRP